MKNTIFLLHNQVDNVDTIKLIILEAYIFSLPTYCENIQHFRNLVQK